MIAALAALAAFAYLALTLAVSTRAALSGSAASLVQVQRAADADAGLAIAIRGLSASSPGWPLAGSTHQVAFGGRPLRITTEDENGKAPINLISEASLRRLVQLAGAPPGAVDSITAAIVEMRGDPVIGGAPDARGTQRGPIVSLSQLRSIPGMTQDVFDRISHAVSLQNLSLVFDPRTAPPLALAVMSPDTVDTARTVDQRPVDPSKDVGPLTVAGHVVTIAVDVRDHQAWRRLRSTTLEFTGSALRPWVVRGVE